MTSMIPLSFLLPSRHHMQNLPVSYTDIGRELLGFSFAWLYINFCANNTEQTRPSYARLLLPDNLSDNLRTIRHVDSHPTTSIRRIPKHIRDNNGPLEVHYTTLLCWAGIVSRRPPRPYGGWTQNIPFTPPRFGTHSLGITRTRFYISKFAPPAPTFGSGDPEPKSP